MGAASACVEEINFNVTLYCHLLSVHTAFTNIVPTFVDFVMASPEITLAISAVAFGVVIGFLSGYSVRAYISFLHRRERLPPEGLYRLDAATRKPFLHSM
jgi:hypothetical protein